MTYNIIYLSKFSFCCYDWQDIVLFKDRTSYKNIDSACQVYVKLIGNKEDGG